MQRPDLALAVKEAPRQRSSQRGEVPLEGVHNLQVAQTGSRQVTHRRRRHSHGRKQCSIECVEALDCKGLQTTETAHCGKEISPCAGCIRRRHALRMARAPVRESFKAKSHAVFYESTSDKKSVHTPEDAGGMLCTEHGVFENLERVAELVRLLRPPTVLKRSGPCSWGNCQRHACTCKGCFQGS